MTVLSRKCRAMRKKSRLGVQVLTILNSRVGMGVRMRVGLKEEGVYSSRPCLHLLARA
jgi:hypothetical protein